MFQTVREQKRSCYKVLLIDNDIDLLDNLLTGFEILNSRQNQDYDVYYFACDSGALAWDKIQESKFDLIILDTQVSDIVALDFLAKIKAYSSKTEVIIVSGDETLDFATKATNRGAYSFIKKPYGLEECFSFVYNCIEQIHSANVQSWLVDRYTRFLQQSSLGILHLDTEGNTLSVNDKFLSLFNIESSILQDFNLLESLKDLLKYSEYSQLLNCLETECVFTADDFFIPSNHFLSPPSSLYFKLSLYRVQDDEKEDAIVAMFFNETEKVKSKIQLEQARKAQEKALKVKNEFLAQMGHELRTPLHSILGYSKLLIQHLDEGSTSFDFSNHINNSSRHLLEILNEILETSNIEFENINEYKTLFDLHQLFDEIEASFSSELSGLNGVLEIRKDNNIPVMVCMDKRKVRWVLDQLLHLLFTNSENQKLKMVITYIDSTLKVEFIRGGLGANILGLESFETEEDLQDRFGLKNFIIKSYLKILKGRYYTTNSKGLVVEFALKYCNDSSNILPEISVENRNKRPDPSKENIKNIHLEKEITNHLSKYAKIGDIKSLKKEINLIMIKNQHIEPEMKILLNMVEDYNLRALNEVLDGNKDD